MGSAGTVQATASPCHLLPRARPRIAVGPCLLLLLLFAIPAAAQQTDLTQLSIEDLMNTRVTSVSKKDQSLSRTAAAIFVITADAIQRSGAPTFLTCCAWLPASTLLRSTPIPGLSVFAD